MGLPKISISFVWVILGCGLISLVIIWGNLAFLGTQRHPEDPRKYLSDTNPHEGRKALISYGCGGCHNIPGIGMATGRVGPSLVGIGEQMFLAGNLKNDPENMVRWIRFPQKISHDTAMPDLGVTEAEARNMAAYLYGAD